MALTAEEEILISIIEFNQRKIEELLISRSQAYQLQNNLLMLSPAAASKTSNSQSSDSISDECVKTCASDSKKTVPKILTSFTKDSTKLNNQNENTLPTVKESTDHEGMEIVSNVIVDHSIPLPMPSHEPSTQLLPPSKGYCSPLFELPETKPEKEKLDAIIKLSEGENEPSNIPGIGQDASCCQSVAISKVSGINQSKQLYACNDDAKKSGNVWIINKNNGKRRKKARSSSPGCDLRNKCQPPSKRKRCHSSSSVMDSTSLESVRPTPSFDSNSITNDHPESRHKIEVVIEDESESSATDNSEKPVKETSLVPVKKEDNLSPKISNTAASPKKKTKILQSSMKRKRQSSAKVNPKIVLKPSPSLSNSLEPYVACWAHCPAISTSSAHCVPKHKFMDHLMEYHTPPRSITLRNQQIVCICHACETVVPYNFKSKTDHLNKRCTKWHQQFFLFIENAQDNYAIPQFNAPVVKSPGLAGMFKSISHHPHLDTLTWKNVKNEHFCYHFCSFCYVFVDDTMRSVTDHKSTAIHRVNVRKCT